MKIRNDRTRWIDFAASLTLVVAIGAVLPVVSSAAAGDSPMIPINVEIRPASPLSPDAESRIRSIVVQLIQENLPDILAMSARADATANVSQEGAKGYMVEVLVMSLYKQSFTAQMSRIFFAYGDGRATLLKVERNFQPSW